MIIISNKPGQLGNLLFIYANFLAYGLENNVRVLNPSFYDYKNYFTNTSKFSLSKNKFFYSLCYIFARVLFKLKIKTTFINVIALDWGETIDLEKESGLKSKLCFVQGWLFRSDKLVVKHKPKIIDFFSPTQLFKNKITDFFNQNFSPNETIIAIHIRHGDYKTFENGKYYYSTEQYIGIIKKLALLFEKNNPHFLICSNEPINFIGEDTKDILISIAPGHELLDMYCLAKCNYIAGPPSTYSMWASFYGNVPLYMIRDLNKEISLNDFKIELST